MTDWNQIPDDEFDGILRKSAENYTLPLEEEDWNRLSLKLSRGNGRRLKVLPYLLLLLFLIDVALQPGGERSAAPPYRTENTRPKASKEGIHGRQQAASPERFGSRAGGQAENKKLREAAAPESVPPAADLPASGGEPTAEREAPAAEARSSAPGTAPLQRLNPSRPATQAPLLPPVIRPEAPAEPAQERGFSLRVVYSPDLSTVGANPILKVGSNTGLLAEYRFNCRWSLQTGVLKSIKYYSALPEQYTSTYPLKNISQIDATCTMLDIPLNLRYDFARSPLQSWFASAGFTSYLMLNEKYTYQYPYGPSRNGWEGKTGFYPLGVLNFSVGYERQLFKNISLQAEPFLKAPLQKVGYGNVKLATLGLFISAKITLPTQPPRADRRIRW